MNRPPFLDQEPPDGYIAGIGRGATGFSTRGDKKQRVPVRERATTPTPTHDEPSEAEQVFLLIDAKRNGKTQSPKNTDTTRTPTPFSDLKRHLGTVSTEQWLHIPEASDMTRRNKRARLEEQLHRKTYAAPDSLGAGGNVDLAKLTADREKLLQKSLDASAARPHRDTPPDTTTVDTTVDSGDASETARQRVLLRSYRRADPHNTGAWLAAAQLEERSRRAEAARRLIAEACEHNPHSPDLWLEAVRLHSVHVKDARVVVARGLRFNPHSAELWLRAAELETRSVDRYRVVRRALERVPESEPLWLLAVQLERGGGAARARILQRALQFVPGSFALWRLLLETQRDRGDVAGAGARATLNKARKALPHNLRVWVLALQLEESQDTDRAVPLEKLVRMLQRGVAQCGGGTVTFAQMLELAREVETAPESHARTLQAIVEVGMSLPDLAAEESRGVPRTLRKLPDSLVKLYCLKHAAVASPQKLPLWRALSAVCERMSRLDELYTSLAQCAKEVPRLSLVYAKEVWRHTGDVERALQVVSAALEQRPGDLETLFAKLKLLGLAHRYDDMASVFEQCSTASSPRLYYKHVNFLRFRGDTPGAVALLEKQYIPEFPTSHKLYLQLGQALESLGQAHRASEAYTRGIDNCRGDGDGDEPLALLYTALAHVQAQSQSQVTRARATLDVALGKCPGARVSLTLSRVSLELRAGNEAQARLLLAEALQRDPRSPQLWARHVSLLPRAGRKTGFRDALERTGSSSAPVLLAVARSFYSEAQYGTAAKWCERAAKADERCGDAWVWWARSIAKGEGSIAKGEGSLDEGERSLDKSERSMDAVYSGVVAAEPVYGPEWTSVSKDPATQYLSALDILKKLVPGRGTSTMP